MLLFCLPSQIELPDLTHYRGAVRRLFSRPGIGLGIGPPRLTLSLTPGIAKFRFPVYTTRLGGVYGWR